MKRVSAFLLVLLLPVLVSATDPPKPPSPAPQPTPAPVINAPTVTLPVEVNGNPGEWIPVKATVANAGAPKWIVLNPEDPKLGVLVEVPVADIFGIDPNKMTARVYRSDTPGKYKVLAYAGGANQTVSEPSICLVTVKGVAPQPIPPEPPTPPGPGPIPPGPSPTSGKNVLILFDTAAQDKYPEKQRQIIYGREFRDYLNTHTDLEADGKMHAYRIWPADTDASNTSKPWPDLMQKKPQSLPWLIVSNGKTGYEGPLPGTVKEALDLVKKYLD